MGENDKSGKEWEPLSPLQVAGIWDQIVFNSKGGLLVLLKCTSDYSLYRCDSKNTCLVCRHAQSCHLSAVSASIQEIQATAWRQQTSTPILSANVLKVLNWCVPPTCRLIVELHMCVFSVQRMVL